MPERPGEALANEDVLSVLRQQLPAELQQVESVEELLDYGIAGARAERDRAVASYIRTKKLSANVRLLSRLEEGARAYIDVGSGIFLPAKLQSGRILVDIGYQFYVEMDAPEAERFSSQRLTLQRRNVDALNRKVAEQRAQAFIIAEALCSMSTPA